VAAVLMPASSLSILLITFGSSNVFAARLIREPGGGRVTKIMTDPDDDHQATINPRILLRHNSNGA
jgi:hypothetical protein